MGNLLSNTEIEPGSSSDSESKAAAESGRSCGAAVRHEQSR